jgi:hypothetical protein
MRTLAEVQKAAREAQILIDILVEIGGKDGPAKDDRHAVQSATEWFEEMKDTSTSSIESGLLMLTQYVENDVGTGYFQLYVQVDCT